VTTLVAAILAGTLASAHALPSPNPDVGPCYPSPEAVARADLEEWRAENFAGVAESALTTGQASRVNLGAVGYTVWLDVDRVAGSRSILDACLEDRTTASVPFLLGDRVIGETSAELTTGGWQWASTACESSRGETKARAAHDRLTAALGGAPDVTREVLLGGSSWLVAKRGSTEAAVLVDYFAWGTVMGGWQAPGLPREGEAISSTQFRSLVVAVRDHERQRAWTQWVECAGAVIVVAGLVALTGWRLWRRRRVRGQRVLTEQSHQADKAPVR
jgi:hypothetical protein